MARILLIDDDEAGRQMAAFNLSGAGHRVDEAPEGRSGLAAFERMHHQLVITDLKMPELSGIDVTREIQRRAADVPVLVISAFGSIDTAVEAMKAGAHDFVLKPFSRDQLLMAVDKALQHSELARENRELRRKLLGVERPIVYRSAAFAERIARADRVAASSAAVLISGESGTGKELFARRIHARSKRGEAPFVVVNCAAVPDTLIEAELFGHEKGAFTGAERARPGRFRQADGGTLFLDEVAELPPPAQSKLLRVLQEGQVDVLGADRPVRVDVRIIAATNRDLPREIDAGSFREDLYFRLNVIEIDLPPLRSRPQDIPELVRHCAAEIAPERDIVISESLLELLVGRRWPGNVRELRNAVERMTILAPDDTLRATDLPPERGERGGGPARRSGGVDWPDLPPEGFSLLDLEKGVIERALAMKRGNMSETARYLRIPRHILVYRIEKYGIAKLPKA